MNSLTRRAASPGRGASVFHLPALSLALALPAQSALVVDDFDDGPIVVVSSGTSSSDTVAASVTGGFRSITVEAQPSLGTSTAEVAPSGLPGLLDVANNIPPSRVTLLYDGDGAGLFGLGAGDFSGETRFELAMATLQLPDPGDTLSASIRVTDADGDSSQVTRVLGLPFVTPTSYFFNFAEYSGLVDFARLDAIEVVFDSGDDDSLDFQVERVEAVPEPSAFALLAGALIPFWLRRRRSGAS